MIISHKLQCIYIKLAKVGGTSFEIALSKYCGKDDVITPIIEEDEAIRKSLVYRGAQNYKNLQEEKLDFHAHSIALEIQTLVPPAVWNNYLKIATVRCPYDMYISHYYNQAPRWKRIIFNGKAFARFVSESSLVLDRIHGLHIKGKIVADFLIRYEYLSEDIKELETKIACPDLLKTFQGINAKTRFRPRRRTTADKVYSKCPRAKSIIDERCRARAGSYEFFQTYWPMYKTELEKIIVKRR